MIAFYITLVVIFAVATLYFAARSREFRKFLAGAFFVSGGVQLYFYFANVSVPLLGTSFVQTPEISRVRGVVHFILFVTCLYLGFVRKPKGSRK
jgi:hypothetical protein